MKHYKKIAIMATGMIVAEVWSEDGRRTALKFFNTGFLDQFRNQNVSHMEKRCKEAHEWADKTVVLHDKYDVKGETL